MRQKILFCFFIAIGLTVNAGTVFADISGRVLNQAGQGIAGAVLSLVVDETSVTAGPDGHFSFATNTAGLPSLGQRRSSVILRGDRLYFRLPGPSMVKVEIFDLKGTLLKREWLNDAETGFHRLGIAQHYRSMKLFIVQASIEGHVTMFRLLPISSSNGKMNSCVDGSVGVDRKPAKTKAIIDTLKVTAANYAAKAVPVTSYDTTVDVTLDTAGDPNAVTVRLDMARQEIAGFGINNNWKPLGSDGINACFDSVSGLGLSILRIGMFSDGNLFSGNNWNDVKDAKTKGCKYIIGSTWSPPGTWKSGQNGGASSENGGGHLNKDKYESWAERIAAFPGKVKQNTGADLYAMSIGNEPDFASCGMSEPCNGDYPTTLYTAEEMVAFIKVAGPKLKAAGCKVMSPEASEWIHTWSDTSGCCSVPGGKPSSDPMKCGFPPSEAKCPPGKGYSYGKYLYQDKEAWASLDILGVHQYDTQRAEPWPDYIPENERKPVWQTEMSGVKWWPEGTPDTGIENGLAVAGWIHDALTVGEANAWLYWWYNGGSGTNEGLLLNGQDTKRHYTFGNYTKYVRPGMLRVEITGPVPEDVLLTAFKGNGGKVVIVAINKSATAASVPITISGGTAPDSFSPVVTSSGENWASKSAVQVSGGKFTAELGGKTITTFLGE